MKKRTFGKAVKYILLTCLTLSLALLLFGIVYVGVVAAKLDINVDREVMESMRGSRTTRLYVSDGSVPREDLTLSNYRPVEIDLLYGEENLVWADSKEIPNALKEAFIAIEDRRFYTHRGIDVKRTAHAILNYIFPHTATFGGSTITQQLVKNVHGEKEVTAKRKLKEIIRAYRVEKEYTKEEILTYYLNIVPLGNRLVGVRAASRYYFGKEPNELSVEECASLAAITNAPARYDPITHREDHIRRRNLVLNAMAECGYLEYDTCERLKEREVVLSITDPIYTNVENNWYKETVISDVLEDLQTIYDISQAAATTMLYRGGLEIYTLMDPAVQKELETYFENPSNFQVEGNPTPNAAMTILDARTGDLLGVVGGIGEMQGSRLLNRATQAYYPPGSAIKPLSVYGPAIEENLVTYATAFEDMPTLTEKGLWPHNSPNLYDGRIPLHLAVAKSKNTVSVEVLKRVGKEKSFSYLANRLHFQKLTRGTGEKTDLALAPLALGQLTYGVTTREMAAAFTSFSSGGKYQTPRSYLAVYDRRGRVLLENEKEENRVWSEDTAFIMTKLMEEVVNDGTARRIRLKEVVDTAGKTGTSGGDKDKWFVGYTPYCVGAIHVGYEGEANTLSGTHIHLTAWDQVMKNIHRHLMGASGESPRSFTMPKGVVTLPFCRDSGMVPTDACRHELRGDRTQMGYFKTGAIPFGNCDSHITAHYDMESESYGTGEGGATSFDFYIFDPKNRTVPEGVILGDTPYTLSYLIEQNEAKKHQTETEQDPPQAMK